MRQLFIGVDTSNYTTSLAAADSDGKIIANIKRLLPVAEGERGLRQSDALFAHTKALPELIGNLSETVSLPDRRIAAVGFSSAPRFAKGSYIPCFLAGHSAAASIACGAKAPLFSSSHQEGHIAAALYSASALSLTERKFISFHVSGGTTDILLVSPDRERIIRAERIGGTLDINAGQAIDRAGVMMGMSFPAGAHLEKAALGYVGKIPKAKICVNGFDCNLSGLENKTRDMYERSGDVSETAAYVFEFVSLTLCALTENLRREYPDIPIVYAGGVMSSVIIRNRLDFPGAYFAAPEFSSDNAAGCALLCREKFMRGLSPERG